MTTVERESVSRAEMRLGMAARRKGAGRRMWQVPLLLAGLGVFGFGIRSLVKAIRPVPFETQVNDIRALLKAGESVRAIDQLNSVGNYYVQRNQQAQLQWLAGDAHYLAQAKQQTPVPENYARVLDHYRKAVALGALPTSLMNERWGLAALHVGDGKLAVEKLEAAAGEDPEKLLTHAHELVAAYLMTANLAKADDVLQRVLTSNSPALTLDDRAWGYCKRIELALTVRHTSGKSDALDSAVDAAEQAVKGIPERDPSGRILVAIGRAQVEEGKLEPARLHLEDARKRFIVHHIDDGRAAVLLGKVAEAQGRLDDAAALFQEVVMSQTRTPVWVAARFGRAEVAALKGDAGTDTQTDYRYVLKTLMHEQESAGKGVVDEGGPAELVELGQVRASLEENEARFVQGKKYEAALRFLTLLGELQDKPTAPRVMAWAVAREARARQLLEVPATMPAKAAPDAGETPRPLLKQAAEDYLTHSKMTTMDDAVSGNSLWKAAQLFDEAGETMKSIEVYDRFTSERPRDPRVAEGLLAIGRLYQSVGMYDKAIPVYRRNIEQNGRTPGAYRSAVNLARCYMMQSPEAAGGAEQQFKKAEAALLSLVQDNGDILPTANEYRISVLTLGELYYHNGKWADAILRLEEAIERYPDDPAITRATFLLAESYRRSAGDIAEALKKEEPGEQKEALAKAHADRLARAGELFGQVIDRLDTEASQKPAPAAGGMVGGMGGAFAGLEDAYLKTSTMDRADCYFSAGNYADAIKLYDAAATRFSQDLTAVEAYLQIVNAYQAMKEPAQASAAAERARWVLKRIPDDAFEKGPVKSPRSYYEELLTLATGK